MPAPTLARRDPAADRHARRRLQALLAALLMPWAMAMPCAHAQAPACGTAPGAPIAGVYRAAGGALISVLPEGAPDTWRITHFASGRSHLLLSDGAGGYQSAGDFASREPVVHRYAFEPGSGRPARTLVIETQAAAPTIARRVDLVEQEAAFRNGDVALRGRLTLPPSGRGPFRAVIFVHGSDPVPSAGLEWLPHLLAPHGIATLVFDKRGTGCSQGRYVQHFDVLADDVVAAARWLAAQPGIDPGRIGLAGFSQGGWVAPLAARKHPSIRFVAVGYGLAMSMADEDRLEAPLKLKAQGVDDASIAEFEALNASLHQLARDGFKDWRSFEQQLERAKGRPWFATAARQPSWLGLTVQMGLDEAKRVAPGMFQQFFQPFYDPVPTLQQLSVPMLWLMAGRDIEAPPGPTLEVLAALRGQGKPVRVVVFPHADHGMQDIDERDGQRVRTRYADGYFPTLLNWLRDPK